MIETIARLGHNILLCAIAVVTVGLIVAIT
jgi:hypothetical protein